VLVVYLGDGSLAISLIREIGCTDPKDYVRDAAGADNARRFLVELADRLPKLMSQAANIPLSKVGRGGGGEAFLALGAGLASLRS
jgi:hypothetical protein